MAGVGTLVSTILSSILGTAVLGDQVWDGTPAGAGTLDSVGTPVGDGTLVGVGMQASAGIMAGAGTTVGAVVLVGAGEAIMPTGMASTTATSLDSMMVASEETASTLVLSVEWVAEAPTTLAAEA